MGNRGRTRQIHTIFRAAIAIALALAVPSLARADAVDQGQALAAQAIKATEAGDFAGAADYFRQALALRPNHPGLTLRLARMSARANRNDDALRALEDYAAMGLKTNPDHPDFKSIAAHPRMAAISAKLADNARPVGAPAIFATIDEPRLLAEGIAHDPATGRTYIGDVHSRRVLMLDAGGKTATLIGQRANGLFGAFGMTLDNGTLWIASSALPHAAQLTPADKGRAGIFAFDTNGRFKKSALLAADGKEFALGDLAVAKSGDVYASDSIGANIYRLLPGASALETFIESDEFHSPQGIALSPDESKMAVADYSNGVHIIDRATKRDTVLPMPAHTTLHGIDALVRHGRDLVAVQNGIDPQRVIVIRMNAAWTAIEATDVIAANLPDMSEPTLATLVEGDLLVIGNGQWSRFADDGTIKAAEPFAPTKILRLKLPRQRP
jgi:tetratricopeptide (TPR) repeat protein